MNQPRGSSSAVSTFRNHTWCDIWSAHASCCATSSAYVEAPVKTVPRGARMYPPIVGATTSTASRTMQAMP
jgi:hypothetical protein